MENFEKFKNLLVMAASDGSLTDREIQFLTARAEKWGISDRRFADAVEYALSSDAELVIPPGKALRREMLGDLIRMMAADGHLAEIEKQLFASAAAQMDLSDDELQSLFDSVLG